MSKNNLHWNFDDLSENQQNAVMKGVRKEIKEARIGIKAIKTCKVRDKYNRSPKEERTVDGIAFDSKKEMNFYLKLRLDPDVSYFLRQVSFDLPAGYKHKVDFMAVMKDGAIRWFEVKGLDLPHGKMKRRQVEELYGITIEVI